MLAYANKESIVLRRLMPLVASGQLIPVDSEHSAIFQCLARTPLISRGSGLPALVVRSSDILASTQTRFGRRRLGTSNLKMGAKITNDCATLMNKALSSLRSSPLDTRMFMLVHRQSRGPFYG